ncbi:unnamed protein product [Ceratitis capitata]|uniref:(Mediterranean fruit fly) hypothetical protein n=1 Tax=Ceratitis capitata TaxID=7213 RepID=A0A811V6P4_CERCA|nr:unnamed protein product [Ceratitis capitata]
MEDLRTTVTNLTGAVNAILEKMNSLERRIVRLDTISAASTMSPGTRPGENDSPDELPLQAPANEADLKDISRLSLPAEKMEVDGSIQSSCSDANTDRNVSC